MPTQLQKARLKFSFPPGDAGKPMRDAVSAAFYSLRASIGTAEHPEVMGTPWVWKLTSSPALRIESDKLREHLRLNIVPAQAGEGVKEQMQRLKETLASLNILQEPAGGAQSQPSIDLKKNGPLVEIAA
jgi:hypothetical protein